MAVHYASLYLKEKAPYLLDFVRTFMKRLNILICLDCLILFLKWFLPIQ